MATSSFVARRHPAADEPGVDRVARICSGQFERRRLGRRRTPHCWRCRPGKPTTPILPTMDDASPQPPWPCAHRRRHAEGRVAPFRFVALTAGMPGASWRRWGRTARPRVQDQDIEPARQVLGRRDHAGAVHVRPGRPGRSAALFGGRSHRRIAPRHHHGGPARARPRAVARPIHRAFTGNDGSSPFKFARQTRPILLDAGRGPRTAPRTRRRLRRPRCAADGRAEGEETHQRGRAEPTVIEQVASEQAGLEVRPFISRTQLRPASSAMSLWNCGRADRSAPGPACRRR